MNYGHLIAMDGIIMMSVVFFLISIYPFVHLFYPPGCAIFILLLIKTKQINTCLMNQKKKDGET